MSSRSRTAGPVRTLRSTRRWQRKFAVADAGAPCGGRFFRACGEPDRFSGLSEVLLFAAARREHALSTIIPRLRAGEIVICDRFVASTKVYQGYGHGVSLEAIDAVHRMSCPPQVQVPDLTILIDMDARDALARSKRRLHAAATSEDRFERLPSEFFERVADGFRRVAAAHPQQWAVVDGRGSVEDVHIRVLDALRPLLALRTPDAAPVRREELRFG